MLCNSAQFGVVYTLLMIACLSATILVSTATQQQQPASARAAGSCSIREQSATCHQMLKSAKAAGAHQALPQQQAQEQAQHADREMQDQLRSQQRLLNVLGNVTAKVITAEAALTLLQDVTVLRTSLAHGAAAQRWAKLKARANRRQHSAKQTQQHQEDLPQTHHKEETLISPTRGILVVAGGLHQLMNTHILLQLLRSSTINCRLPVEVVYYGHQEYHAKAASLITSHAKATGTSVTFIDGYTAAPSKLPPHKAVTPLIGFKTKVHALAFVTSFEQVLMLDSDNTPLADPSYLFETDSFTQTGNIQWVDFWKNQWMQPVIYDVLGLDVPWHINPGFRASEAGQLLIDRIRHHDVLEWLWLLNTHSNSGVAGQSSGIVGKCLWGDKDTYPIAFHLAGKAHFINNIQHYPLQALSMPGHQYMHAGMVQRGVFGELLFLHRTAAGKLWPHCVAHGLVTCKVWGLTTPVDQDQLVPSVRDVTAMAFESDKVDTAWQVEHCASQKWTESGTAGVVDSATSKLLTEQVDMATMCSPDADSSSGPGDSCMQRDLSTATLLHCDLEESLGVLPIPVIAAERLPLQVQQMMNVTYDLFIRSLQQSQEPIAADPVDDLYYDPSDPYL